jgi:hypothetical protein
MFMYCPVARCVAWTCTALRIHVFALRITNTNVQQTAKLSDGVRRQPRQDLVIVIVHTVSAVPVLPFVLLLPPQLASMLQRLGLFCFCW